MHMEIELLFLNSCLSYVSVEASVDRLNVTDYMLLNLADLDDHHQHAITKVQ